MTQDTAADSTPPKRGMRGHANFLWRFILFARPFFSAQHKWRNRGWLALTMRMLGGPISLLGAAVLDVFRRHAAQSWREHGQCRGDYMRAFKVLGGASALFVLALAPSSEALFQFAFGAPWRMAGTIAFWLLPMFAFRFVASPLSYMFYVADKQHIDLLWQFTLLCMTLASLLLPASYSAALQIYSLGYSGMYIIYLLLSYRFSLGPAQ